LLEGEDADPLRHQLIEIPPITPLVIEHRLHRLVCPCCSTSTGATLPADEEASHYVPRLSSLVGELGSASPLSFSQPRHCWISCWEWRSAVGRLQRSASA
jgi:hypothetical protein